MSRVYRIQRDALAGRMPFATTLDADRGVAGCRCCGIFLRRCRVISGGEAVSDGDGTRLANDARLQVGCL